MTVGKLMEAYETCIAKLRKSQSNRRKISLKKVEEANFSKEVRILCTLKIVLALFSVSIMIQVYYMWIPDSILPINIKHKLRSRKKI